MIFVFLCASFVISQLSASDTLRSRSQHIKHCIESVNCIFLQWHHCQGECFDKRTEIRFTQFNTRFRHKSNVTNYNWKMFWPVVKFQFMLKKNKNKNKNSRKTQLVYSSINVQLLTMAIKNSLDFSCFISAFFKFFPVDFVEWFRSHSSSPLDVRWHFNCVYLANDVHLPNQ